MALSSIIDPDQGSLFRTAAREIAAYLTNHSSQQHLVLGLCGGRSIVGLLSALASSPESLTAFAPKLQIFLVDERLVSLDHPDSNYRLLKAELFDRLISSGVIGAKQIHPFTEDGDAVSAAERYAQLLETFGGRFDVAFLGAGEDGHVASLFPAHTVLRAELPFVIVEDSPKPPSRRITASAPLLAKSGLTVVMFIGDSKREAYKAFGDEEAGIEICPAKIALEADETLVISNLAG